LTYSNSTKLSSGTDSKQPTELEFSKKYDLDHSQNYRQKHQDGLSRRLSNWRDGQLARRALLLAGEPQTVLDLPCGAGRFWEILSEAPNRVLYAADNSPHMIQVAQQSQPRDIVKNVRAFQTSAFDIDMPDASVDSIFCMRLFHHIYESKHRLEILNEFHRVSRDSVILSLWVDGNLKAWKRKRLERKRARKDSQSNKNRFVLKQSQVEREFEQAGFRVEAKLDFLPYYAMWRVYVLKKVRP
jgi:SAM-dependent methyltransferase